MHKLVLKKSIFTVFYYEKNLNFFLSRYFINKSNFFTLDKIKHIASFFFALVYNNGCVFTHFQPISLQIMLDFFFSYFS